MHSAIFVAKVLEKGPREAKASQRCRAAAENVWLVNLQESVAPLGWLVALSEQRGVSYRILPFQAAPEWLPAGGLIPPHLGP
jgi:hypothetical protein